MDRRTFQGFMFSAGIGLLLAGCGGGDEDYKTVGGNQPEVPEAPGHHDVEGPHGGHVYDLGDHDYMVEVVFDEQTRKITVYVLDHDDPTQPAHMDSAGAKLALHVEGQEEPVELALTAVPQDGDPDGQAAQFEAAGEAVPESITHEEQLDARLSFTQGEKSFSALIEPHEHHDDHNNDTDHGGHKNGDKDHGGHKNGDKDHKAE